MRCRHSKPHKHGPDCLIPHYDFCGHNICTIDFIIVVIEEKPA